MGYYNTNGLSGQELDRANRSADSQEHRILQFFRKNHERGFTPEEIQEYCQMTNRPLTSTRRALTNLSTDGFLRKTDTLKMGKYGKPIHSWVLQERKGEQLKIL